MNTAVLILAAGPASRGWTEENPKQLAIIEGKPLIVRTLDQLKERGYDDNVMVVTRSKVIQAIVPRYFEPAVNIWRSQTILSAQELWADRTVIIHGDTIFSDAAMDFIIAEQGPLALISVGDKVHTEAWVFTKEVRGHVIESLKVAGQVAIKENTAPLSKRRKFLNGYHQAVVRMHWAFYRALSGLPIENLDSRVFNPDIHRVLKSDYTCDLDSPGYYVKFIKRHKWARGN